MAEPQVGAEWPRVFEIELSAELHGRRVSTPHLEQAKAAAQAAFVASLTGHPTPYELRKIKVRARYLYVGADSENATENED